MKFHSRTIENLKRLKAFLKELKVEPVHLLVPSLLALVASIFEGASLMLIAPTARGLMEGNFKFVSDLPLIGSLIKAHPELFANGNALIFAMLAGLVFVSVILKSITFYLSAILITKQVRRLSDDLRRLLFDSYIQFKKSFFDKNSTGHLQNTLIGYTEQIAVQFRNINQALYFFFCILVYLVLMIYISWKVAFFSLICFPALVLIFNQLIGKIRRDSQVYAQLFTGMGKKISNSLTCIPLIKASCMEEKERKWFAFTSSKVKDIQFSMDRKGLLIQPAQEIFIITLTMIMLCFMAYLIVRTKEGHLSGYLVFFLLLRRMLSCVGGLANLQGQLASVVGPLRDVIGIYENRAKNYEQTGVLPFLTFKDKIEFKNLSFSYGDRMVLKSLSFEIMKGKMVAIVGVTGSGKSTIAQLLMRFYDSPSGMLLIDGQDILHYQVSALRRKIAYISQDNYFFDASIEVNLKYGCPKEPSADEIISALEKAQLKDLIQKLPNGIGTEIGERGIQLSGGEKQRLSLARAVLRNPEILILDEATSAMDSQTEKLVQAAIAEASKGRTSIVVAHRLATIQKADLILVLDHGRIVESGSFSDLIKTGSRFKVFWDSQQSLNRSA